MNNLITLYKADYYISKKVHNKPQTPPRTVSCFEIELYTTSGSISVTNGIKYPQEKNNILVSTPGDIRYSISNFECYCLHFSTKVELITNTLNRLPKVFKPAEPSKIRETFEEINHSRSIVNYAGNNLITQGKILELIGLLANEVGKAPIEKYEQYSQNISSACTFMVNNLHKHITLSDISKAAALSPSHFHNVFKATNKLTPTEYLIRLRVSMAKNLLRNSDMPLSEIAIRCGFDSQSYFNYVFKRETGTTPKKYRTMQHLII